MPLTLRACCFLFCAIQSSLAFSYGPNGHQAIGELANRYIADTNAETEVKALLKKVGPNITLQQAAVWADCAKGVSKNHDGKFVYTVNSMYAECRPFETKKGQAMMIDFVRRNWDGCTSFTRKEACHKQYHYTDIAIQRDAYQKNEAGTSEIDIVSSLSAAIAVLQGRQASAPFKIKNKTEALLLLAHYMGDIHQPLHVGAVYLNDSGQLIDPDQGTLDHATETRGGNQLKVGPKTLHSLWDTVPKSLDADHMGQERLKALRKIEKTKGPVEFWPTIWATETLQAGKLAFDGIEYSAKTHSNWQITLPPGYSKAKTDIQREELLKAGARFGQLLEAIWP